MKVEPISHVSFKTQMCSIGSARWSVARLVGLSADLEVMDVPLAHMDMWITYKSLTLRELAGHVKATNEADMSKPIILDEDGCLMDGRHRIMRALIEGIETVKAVRFSENPSPCEVVKE